MASSRSKRGGGGSNKEMEVRRGPWTLEEDTLLIHYITCHGEGRWNLLARCSGLKRTGKSCRLRWLNYLKPDIKRGNLSPEEQLLILDLHSRWGNRWSRIAQYLPGRTDNEIKNYWRTRVQKQARQLKIDANSTVFRDALRCYWMPRLLEKYGAAASAHRQFTQSLAIDLACSSGNSGTAPGMILDDRRHHQSHSQHLQDLHSRPSSQCGVGYEIAASSAGFNGDSAAAAAAALMISQFPDLPQFSMDEIHGGIELDQFQPIDYNHPITDPAVGCPASDHDITNPNSSSYKNINGGSLWSSDEIYGMLKSYMEIGEEDELM